MILRTWRTVAFGTVLGEAILMGVACTSGAATQPSGVTATPVAEVGVTPTPQPQATPTPEPTPQEVSTFTAVIDKITPEATATVVGSVTLDEADEIDLVRLSMEWALVDKNVPDLGLLPDPLNIVLVLEGFETRIVPKLAGVNLTLLNAEEAQAKADAEGDFPYLRISLYEATETAAQVEVATAMAVSKDSEIGYLVGGGCRLAFEKIDGRWRLNEGPGMCWIS
jgi:hypothetical protein